MCFSAHVTRDRPCQVALAWAYPEIVRNEYRGFTMILVAQLIRDVQIDWNLANPYMIASKGHALDIDIRRQGIDEWQIAWMVAAGIEIRSPDRDHAILHQIGGQEMAYRYRSFTGIEIDQLLTHGAVSTTILEGIDDPVMSQRIHP